MVSKRYLYTTDHSFLIYNIQKCGNAPIFHRKVNGQTKHCIHIMCATMGISQTLKRNKSMCGVMNPGDPMLNEQSP